jgi:hypothetical protein
MVAGEKAFCEKDRSMPDPFDLRNWVEVGARAICHYESLSDRWKLTILIDSRGGRSNRFAVSSAWTRGPFLALWATLGS